jgi:hypothetical protein
VVNAASVGCQRVSAVATSASDTDPIATARTLGRVSKSLPARAIVDNERALVRYTLGCPSPRDRQLAGDRLDTLLERRALRLGLGSQLRKLLSKPAISSRWARRFAATALSIVSRLLRSADMSTSLRLAPRSGQTARTRAQDGQHGLSWN